MVVDGKIQLVDKRVSLPYLNNANREVEIFPKRGLIGELIFITV